MFAIAVVWQLTWTSRTWSCDRRPNIRQPVRWIVLVRRRGFLFLQRLEVSGTVSKATACRCGERRRTSSLIEYRHLARRGKIHVASIAKVALGAMKNIECLEDIEVMLAPRGGTVKTSYTGLSKWSDIKKHEIEACRLRTYGFRRRCSCSTQRRL